MSRQPAGRSRDCIAKAIYRVVGRGEPVRRVVVGQLANGGLEQRDHVLRRAELDRGAQLGLVARRAVRSW
jgi:hypothetical protein